MHNLLGGPSVSSEYLFNSDSFTNLISPEGEINSAFFSSLISKWQKNEQTNLYVNLDNPNSPKIKIDKLIADSKLSKVHTTKFCCRVRENQIKI